MTVRELIEARAIDLATHDGVPAAVIHFHAAASNLMAEIAREKDAAIAALIREAGASINTAVAELLQQASEAVAAPGAVPGEPASPAAAPGPAS